MQTEIMDKYERLCELSRETIFGTSQRQDSLKKALSVLGMECSKISTARFDESLTILYFIEEVDEFDELFYGISLVIFQDNDTKTIKGVEVRLAKPPKEIGYARTETEILTREFWED